MAGLSKAAMPEVVVDGGEECGSVGRWVDGVERTWTVISENHDPAGKSLHRKIKTIKFNGAMVIDIELTNIYEIFDDLWN